MEMAKAKRMVKQINAKHGDVATIREGYSGRGMYGKTTTAIVLPWYAIPKRFKGARDSMALDAVIY